MSDVANRSPGFQAVTLWGTTGENRLAMVAGQARDDGTISLYSALTAIGNVSSVAEPLTALSDNVDAQPALGDNAVLGVANRGQVFNGDSFDVARSASGTVQGATDTTGVPVFAHKGSDGVVHAPGAAAQASVVLGVGGTGSRRVCTGLQASIVTAAAPSGILTVQLLSAAVVLWTGDVQCAALSSDRIQLTGLHIVGGIEESMTLRFTAAGPAGSLEKVSLQTYLATDA